MKTRAKIFLLLLISAFILTNFSTQFMAGARRFQISIDIYAAGYFDLDNDESEDDVFTSFFITVSETPRNSMVDIYYRLKLPSGQTYIEMFQLSLSRDPDLLLSYYTIIGFNTATESGWYTATIDIVLDDELGGVYIASDTIIFDPPNDEEPGEPEFQIIQPSSSNP
jgi:hypothetical protein